MELWLLAILALALIPTVRLFMAQRCRPAAPAPGAETLTVEVTASGANPSTEPGAIDAVVEILNGDLSVNPPSGTGPRTSSVPPGGLFPGVTWDANPGDFEGETAPYRWTSTCEIEFECTSGPGPRLGRRPARASDAGAWDANRARTIRYFLHVVDRAMGTSGPPPPGVHDYQWEFEGSG